MGCKTRNTDLCNNFGGTVNSAHCSPYVPGAGVTYDYVEYPENETRNGNYNIPGRDDNAVMYGYTQECVNTGGKGGSGFPDSDPQPAAGNCGKLSRVPCSSGTQTCTLFQDYIPKELSFDYNYSDTFFAYLYDTSDNAGTVGTPCYYIITRSTTRDDTSASTDSTQECHPCTSFSCDTASTNLRYTAAEDLTGDPDCPHPTLFGFGTTANKLAFVYDELSTELPNGVNDLELSYDGVTYIDGWDGLLEVGIPYSSSQNPWQTGDETLSDFVIYDLNSSQSVTGLRIKVRIEPIFDDTNTPVTFQGTRWLVEEILASGTGYTIGDVFQLEYEHTHPDNSTSTLTLNLKVTGTGPVSAVLSSEGFDILRTGDTINGHVITHTFHTDINNFPYHVIYLDGDGSDFVKDTQYTSSRNHVITAKAGFGIVDRAILVGKYEFLNKSVQYTIGSLNKDAPDIYNTLKQPNVDLTITNGTVTGATIVDGGENWDQLGRIPELTVTSPAVSSGKTAKVKGVFLAGELISLTITDPGSGYTESQGATVYVSNVQLNSNTRIGNDAYSEDAIQSIIQDIKSLPKTDNISVDSAEVQSFEDNYNKQNKFTDVTGSIPRIETRKDPKRNRSAQVPQRLFSEKAVEPLYDKVKRQDNLDYLNDAPLPRDLKTEIAKERERDDAARRQDLANITQNQIPEYVISQETYVETVQGSFSNLPRASTYTKYHLRQYRADPATETSLNITLSCSPVNEGCAHITCPPPSTPANVAGSFEEPLDPPDPQDPEATQTVNTTTTASVSALLGPGCQSWSISGSMKMYHNLSRAAQTVSLATERYGNPY